MACKCCEDVWDCKQGDGKRVRELEEKLSHSLNILRQLNTFVKKSTDVESVNAIYLTPSEALRREASRVESQDSVISYMRRFLEENKEIR